MIQDNDNEWTEIQTIGRQALDGLISALIAAAALVLLAFLSGCGTWRHQTKPAGDFNRDLYECEKEAAPIQDSWRANMMKRQCMQLKGWRQ